LLLVIMWVAAGVFYFRGRPESRSADSIHSFRRQLRVLERAGPVAIDPAHRLRSAGSPLEAGTPSALGQVLAATPSAGAARRRQIQKRRRDLFFGLCLGVAGSLVLGFIPGLHVMWILAAVLAVALLGYVGLLVQVRNHTAERAMKVRFLPHAVSTPEPALLLRRSAN
jgi:hypothetical protein